MGQTNIVDKSKTVNQSVKNIETQVTNSVKNINVDLSKIDLSTATGSFKELNSVLQAADFSKFLTNIVLLQDSFDAFQKKVSSALGSVTKFVNNVPSFTPEIVATNIEIDTGDVTAQLEGLGGTVSSTATSIGSSASQIAGSIGSAANGVETAADSIGGCFLNIGTGVATVVNSFTGLFTAIATVNTSILAAATGITLLIQLLPALGTAILTMAINMSGLLMYLPELLVFLGIIVVLSLLGEGLSLAGEGLLNVGLGLTAMTDGMASLLTFFPQFVECLANTGLSIGGIIMFVLLAVALVAMAVAMQIMNEQFDSFVSNLDKMHGLMSVGFVAAFVVFGVMMIGMSLFMGKVAAGMEKITAAIGKQIAKLAILNPLLAAQAILMNPIVGSITVALALAGGLLVKALIPAMATGGVVSSPTMAMVGEGRYPEAVVPLGNSPQFSQMKNDIASAVMQGIMALGGSRGGATTPTEVVISIDSEKLARTMIPAIERENRRKGFVAQLRSV